MCSGGLYGQAGRAGKASVIVYHRGRRHGRAEQVRLVLLYSRGGGGGGKKRGRKEEERVFCFSVYG